MDTQHKEKIAKTVRFEGEAWRRIQLYLALKNENFQSYCARLVEADLKNEGFEIKSSSDGLVLALNSSGI